MALGYSHPLSLFIVPSHDLLNHRPRLVLSIEVGLHTLKPPFYLLCTVSISPSSARGSASLGLTLLEETWMEIGRNVGGAVG